MPTPLFQYTWQYNNQPIEVLAQDIVNIISGSGSGPVNTANYIPVSNGLTFDNSSLATDDGFGNLVLQTNFPTVGNVGLGLLPYIERYYLGTYDPSAPGYAGHVLVDNSFGSVGMYINGLNSYSIGLDNLGLQVNVDTSLTAGTSSGSYLTLKVNGNDYKLELLNP